MQKILSRYEIRQKYNKLQQLGANVKWMDVWKKDTRATWFKKLKKLVKKQKTQVNEDIKNQILKMGDIIKKDMTDYKDVEKQKKQLQIKKVKVTGKTIKNITASKTIHIMLSKMQNKNIKNPTLKGVLKKYNKSTNIFTKKSWTINYVVDHIVLEKYMNGTVLTIELDNYMDNVVILATDNDIRDDNYVIAVILNDLQDKYKGEVKKIGEVAWTTTSNKKSDFRKLKFKAQRISSRILEDINGFKHPDTGYCVLQSLFNQLIGKDRFKKLTINQLAQQFREFCNIDEGISINDIQTWMDKYGKYLNVHILDGLNKITVLKGGEYASESVCIKLTNGHCYSIENDITKQSITQKHRLELQGVIWDNSLDDYFEATVDDYDSVVTGAIDKDVVLWENCYIPDLINNIIKVTGYNVEDIYFGCGSTIVAFVHPLTKKRIMENNKFELRKKICQTMQEKYNTVGFRNQSITNMSRLLCEKINGGTPPESFYNVEVQDILDDYAPSAITDGYDEVKDNKNVMGFDIFKSYSSVLYHNELDIPLYNVLANWIDYDDSDIQCGEYFLDCVVLGRRLFGVYSWNLVSWLMEKKLIKKSDIKKMLIASSSYDALYFRQLVYYIYINFSEGEAKELVNCLVGWFGKKWSQEIKACITDSREEAYALHACHNNIRIEEVTHLYYIKQMFKSRLIKDHTSINRFVVSGGIKNLFEITLLCSKPDTILLSDRTDCVYLKNYRIPDEKYLVDRNKDVLENLGKIKLEPKIHLVNIKEPIEYIYDDVWKDIKPLVGTGSLYEGGSGFGKSEKSCDEFLAVEGNKKACAFTHKACNVIREKMKARGIDEDYVFVLSKLFNESEEDIKLSDEQKIKILMKYDCIWIDEISMLKPSQINLLYKALQLKTDGTIKLIMSGDMSQLPCIGNEKLYDYFNNDVFVNMCGGKVNHLKYIEGSGRYDKEMADIIIKFRKYGRVYGQFQPYVYSEYNIVKTNKFRKKINQECNKNKSGKLIKFKYQGGYEEYKVYKNMRIMCTVNFKNRPIINGEIFFIKYIDDDKVIIDDNEFTISEFRKSFIPAYAITTYKYQGDSIDTDYNIWEVNQMSANEFGTAIGRTTNLKYIHCKDYEGRKFRKINYRNQKIPKSLPNKNVYVDSKIYLVESSKGKYIGSTHKADINTRLSEHINTESSPLFKQTDATIKLLSAVCCRNRKELEHLEGQYINQYIKDGHELLNTKHVKKEKEVKPKLQIKKYLDNKIKIHDYPDKNYFVINYTPYGSNKQVKILRRYNNVNKDLKYKEMEEKKKEINIMKNSVFVNC